ncbi:hypothetical protein CHH92_24505 [Bacillus sonorensis]|nr:hypothetical protein CHH92_24505 [Bacillus sonorensis]
MQDVMSKKTHFLQISRYQSRKTSAIRLRMFLPFGFILHRLNLSIRIHLDKGMVHIPLFLDK